MAHLLSSSTAEFLTPDTNRSLTIALLRTRESVMQRFRPMLHSHGVTEQQWRVLRVLNEEDRIDAGLLAVRGCVLAPSLSRILSALRDQNWIEFEKDPEDRRRLIVTLTVEGRAFFDRIARQSAEIYGEIENLIGRKEISHLLDELSALQSKLNTAPQN
jgi:homoprotocatechuate degradation regulator HpaR